MPTRASPFIFALRRLTSYPAGMHQAKLNWISCALVALACWTTAAAGASGATAAFIGQGAVVKIHVTNQRENYTMPWQAGPQASGSGTGFIIRGKRILTNAHMVADVRFLEVQK